MTRGLLQTAGVCIDLVYEIDALPERGGEAMARRAARCAGGGFNVMAAAARAGLPVGYAGGLGEGPFADVARAALARLGAPALLPPVRGLDQGDCVVLVEPSGERTFVSRAGAEYAVTEAMLAALDPAGWDWILVTGYGLAVQGEGGALGRWIARLPPDAPVAFDPSPVVSAIPAPVLAAVLARTRWLSLNRAEAQALVGPAEPAAAARALLSGPCPAAEGVVLRLGAEGCLVAGRDGRVAVVPGFPVRALDTTGAGDAHVGAFLAALTEGAAPEAAARFANAAASLSVTRRGPATAPTRAETLAVLAAAAAPSAPAPEIRP